MLERFRRQLRDRLPLPRPANPTDVALREAVGWLFRAQDASADRGVCHSYRLGSGWTSSYPETTGYIVSTLLNWARQTGDPEARRRAIQMCEWECGIQKEDGWIHASVVGSGDPKPVVFNTGQVIFGWVSAFRETGEQRYLDAAGRACRWLIESLGDSDTWSTFGNMGQERAHTYNVRVLWALLEYSLLRDQGHHARMGRVFDGFLKQERGGGWFAANCLTDPERPLLHTIAYTAQGLLECGLLLGDERGVQAARRTADALGNTIRKNGAMAGRYGPDWREEARWSCLTGMAQMSIVWMRLAAITGEERYSSWARKVNRFLRAVQDVRTATPGIRGGIPGSFPINGAYGRFRILNWATKFFVDALLLEENPRLAEPGRFYPG